MNALELRSHVVSHIASETPRLVLDEQPYLGTAIEQTGKHMAFCPSCIRDGYQSPIHSNALFNHCPWHGDPINTACPTCLRSIHSSIAFTRSSEPQCFDCLFPTYEQLSITPENAFITQWHEAYKAFLGRMKASQLKRAYVDRWFHSSFAVNPAETEIGRTYLIERRVDIGRMSKALGADQLFARCPEFHSLDSQWTRKRWSLGTLCLASEPQTESTRASCWMKFETQYLKVFAPSLCVLTEPLSRNPQCGFKYKRPTVCTVCRAVLFCKRILEQERPPHHNIRLVSTFLYDILTVPSAFILKRGTGGRDLSNKVLHDEVIGYFCSVLETYRWITWRSMQDQVPVIADWVQRVGVPLAEIGIAPFRTPLLYEIAPSANEVIEDRNSSIEPSDFLTWCLDQAHPSQQKRRLDDSILRESSTSFVYRKQDDEAQVDGRHTLRGIGARYNGWPALYHVDQEAPELFPCGILNPGNQTPE